LYQLKLSDIKPIGDLNEGETFVQADVTDADAMRELTEGVDGIIHMGGIASEADWASIAKVNLEGTINIYEAARLNKVPRVIVPSSNHAVGFYPRSQTIPVEVMLRPDSRYGVSKAFAELMGSLYFDKYGIRTLALRIGNVAPEPVDTRRLSIWISGTTTRSLDVWVTSPRITRKTTPRLCSPSRRRLILTRCQTSFRVAIFV